MLSVMLYGNNRLEYKFFHFLFASCSLLILTQVNLLQSTSSMFPLIQYTSILCRPKKPVSVKFLTIISLLFILIVFFPSLT